MKILLSLLSLCVIVERAFFGPAYAKQCVAARTRTRQKALVSAKVVDTFDGHIDCWWSSDVIMLNDDRRVPVL